MTAQDLKNSILQLAVQGKLVKQDPNDEPASELLKRIRAEKQKLIKEGKIKRDKNSSEIFIGDDNLPYEKRGDEVRCIADEIPFDIPESWTWCRLGEIFEHSTGKALNARIDTTGTLYKYITTSNLYWNRFELGSLRSMYFKDSELERYTVKKGDLLVCEGGDIGRSAIWNYDYNICFQNHIHKLRAYFKIHTLFFYYVIFFYKSVGLIGGKGIGIKGLSSGTLHNICLPLPPLNEQKRIVEKIEELFPLVEAYGKAEVELATLDKNFPDALKKSILQWAVQGKLVEQLPEEGSAEDLLKQIRSEKEKLIKEGKIKRDKKSSEIIRRGNEFYEKYSDGTEAILTDLPFDIPETWTWCRLETIVTTIPTKNYQILQSEILTNGKYPVVSQSLNIIEGFSNKTEKKLIVSSPLIIFGDHTKCIKYIDFDFIVGADGVKILQPHCINARYLFYLLEYSKIFMRNRGYSRHFQFLKDQVLSLPPLNEQKRIVKQLEAFLNFIQ